MLSSCLADERQWMSIPNVPSCNGPLPDLHQACCAVNHNFVHRRAAVAEPASLDWEER